MDSPYLNKTFMYNLFMKIVNFWQKVENKRMTTETVVMLKLTSKMETSPTIQKLERNILSNCLCCSEIDKSNILINHHLDITFQRQIAWASLITRKLS